MNKQKLIPILVLSILFALSIQAFLMEKEFSLLRSQLNDSLSVFYKRNELDEDSQRKKYFVDIKANSYFLYSLYCMKFQGKFAQQLAIYFDRRHYFIFSFDRVGDGDPHLREFKEEGIYVKGEKSLMLTSKDGKTGHILPFQLNKRKGGSTYELFYYGYPLHTRYCLGQGKVIEKYLKENRATIPLEDGIGEKAPLKRID